MTPVTVRGNRAGLPPKFLDARNDAGEGSTPRTLPRVNSARDTPTRTSKGHGDPSKIAPVGAIFPHPLTDRLSVFFRQTRPYGQTEAVPAPDPIKDTT